MADPRRPPKPWERTCVNNHSSNNPVHSVDPGIGIYSNGENVQTANPFLQGGGVGGSPLPAVYRLPPPFNGRQSHSSSAPPLPPRRTTVQSSYNQGYSPYSLGSYGSMYSSPFSSSYGGYGGFGGYGRYGMSNMMMGRMDPYAANDNGFIQMAEESSRPAFQSIESIVHAVGSVSMMLESTYNAMYSSFRAVIGVAHHFGQMKSQFAQVFSAFAIIRSLRWLCRKILYMLGMQNTDPSSEQVWATVTEQLGNASNGGLSEGDIKTPRSNWPIVMFIVVVFGAPWLIWRMLMSVAGMQSPDISANKQWVSGIGEHFVAVALHDFVGESDQELSMRAGQSMRLAPKGLQPKVRGWVLATTDGKNTGLVPANYIRILGRGMGTSSKPQPQKTQQQLNVQDEQAAWLGAEGTDIIQEQGDVERNEGKMQENDQTQDRPGDEL